VNGQPDPLQPANEANQAVNEQVAAVLQRAMSQNREQRFRSAAEMRKVLDGSDAASTVTSRTEAATVLFPPKTTIENAPTLLGSAASTVANQPTVRASETTMLQSPAAATQRPSWVIPVAAFAALIIAVGGFYAFHRSTRESVTSVTTENANVGVPTASPAVQAVEANVNTAAATVESEKKAVEAEKQAVKAEKKSNERKASTATKREKDDTAESEGHETGVPAEPDVPEPNVPNVSGRPRIRRMGGVTIRNFPDGSQLITSPDGMQVFVRPNGQRVVLRPARPKRPPPQP
jgi:hypothetical protein